METLQVELQRQYSVPDENIPLPTPLGLEQSLSPVVSSEKNNGGKQRGNKQKHKANHANMADSVEKMVSSARVSALKLWTRF